MAFSLGFAGLEKSGTFKIDAATKAVIGKPENEIGKAYVLTGNGTVGRGKDGDWIFGIVQTMEEEFPGSGSYVATIAFFQSQQFVPVTGTVAAGDFILAKGDGTVRKYDPSEDEGKPMNYFVINVNSDGTAAIINR